mmetsp:Transcript_51653/g.135775  ORF Transcript_51653/g.135775 Transcript_51653/m.135775 type:complete len:267 (-) Transcript_51653:14-814(-)
MPEAAAAVTTPSFLKVGASFAILSSGVSRGCSSVSNVSSPFLPLRVIGAISPEKWPASLAAAYRVCDCTAYSSDCSRVMPWSVARFSAVMPIGVPTCESVRPAHSVSTCCRSMPSFVPKRTCWPYTAIGAWLMLSAPAATPTSASPSAISCATFTTDWKPEPHSRLTLSAGVSISMPDLSATCRAMYAASFDVCDTLPTTTVSTALAGTLPAASAALVACTARSVALNFVSLPPNAPNAVRFAATMKVRGGIVCSLCIGRDSVWQR